MEVQCERRPRRAVARRDRQEAPSRGCGTLSPALPRLTRRGVLAAACLVRRSIATPQVAVIAHPGDRSGHPARSRFRRDQRPDHPRWARRGGHPDFGGVPQTPQPKPAGPGPRRSAGDHARPLRCLSGRQAHHRRADRHRAPAPQLQPAVIAFDRRDIQDDIIPQSKPATPPNSSPASKPGAADRFPVDAPRKSYHRL
jgi:hypothetical protein